ncbi:MAG: tetratricopeptide repeat protein, partial [Myxococcales bacterium]|nr:tetratricopeptide repeat protein [Myxococcales bacterium]
AALRESGVGHAEDTWTRVAARIDQWTDAWRDARVSACLAARADELQARARGRCLDQDRWRLEGLLEVLVEPGRELANNAINAAAALPERDHCEEFARRPRALQGGESRELDELHRGLILARALAIAGRNDEALERIQAARAEAERLDDATARVEGLLVDGDIRGELGDYERSEALFAQAWFSALRSGHDRAAARAATELVEIVGVDRGEHARGREWGEHAAAMIDHLGADVTATMRLELTRSRALIDQEAAAYDDADAGLRRALDLAEETFGPAHPLVARSLNDLSVALYQRSRYDEARGYSDRALEVFAAAVGPLHPSYANALMSRGGLLLAVGDASGARQAFEEAARVFESAHGPDHRLVAIALGNIAAVLHAEGDFERARAYAERALAIGERVHGPQHTMVLNQRSSIAVMSLALGDSATALDQLQRGLAAAEEGLGPEHPLTSLLLVNLGAALSAEGRHEEALAASRRGLALVEALYGSDHLDVAFALVNIADTLHALGRDDEARPLAERALAIQERILGAANPTLSRSLTPLARILAARGEGVAAEGHLRRAIALLEPNPGSRDLPIALTELGSLLLAEGRESEAIAPLERAITLQVDRRGFTGTLARSRFLLARALDDTGSDPSRARTLAEQARDDLASSGERDAAKRDEITEWLTQRAAKR